MFNGVESNETLKLKFRKLHEKVVDSVNAIRVINFLFQERVIGVDDVTSLMMQEKNRQRQCQQLLMLLHNSKHPQAFIHLYKAIKRETYLEWLVEDIDKFTEQSVISPLQKLKISDKTGY